MPGRAGSIPNSLEVSAGKIIRRNATDDGWEEADVTPVSTSGWNESSDTITITDEDTLTIASADKTAEYGKGVKLKQTFTGGDQVKALDLEAGSSQLAYITDAGQTGLDITGDISIEAWVKLESSGSVKNVVTKWDSAGNNRSYMFRFESTGLLSLYFSNNGEYTSHATVFQTTQSVERLGEWMHIAVVADVSVPTVNFYINGVLVPSASTATAATSIYNGASDFQIGAENSHASAASFFDGIISEVRVWNDIRTASEIRQNMFKNVAADAANLVGYWKLDNDYLDETSNNNDLTASGSPTFADDVPSKLVSGEMFFSIIGSSFSTNTTLTLTGGSDYYAQDATSVWQFSYAECPQGFPCYFNYLPTFSASGSMTFTSVTFTNAYFSIIGDICEVTLDRVIGTTGGTASFSIYVSLPITASFANQSWHGAALYDVSYLVGLCYLSTTGLIQFWKSGGGNWGLGATKAVGSTIRFKY